MKLAFLCSSVSRSAGGIFDIERRLAQTLVTTPETTVEVFGLRDTYSEADRPLWRPLYPRVFPVLGPAQYGYSPGLRRHFLECGADIAHCHTMWMYPSVVLKSWWLLKRRPFMITLNGMLDPWALSRARWKKRLAFKLYEQACLENAACIQVNSLAELDSARKFGLRGPLCVIPNGVDLPTSWPLLNCPAQRKILLYFGRIHPKKNLTRLLEAWRMVTCASRSSKAPCSHWRLVIAGWGQLGHEEELKKLASNLGIRWTAGPLPPTETDAADASVFFVGPQFGADRAAWYKRCDALILPSFSEGLPMVILEAWAHSRPVLMTSACNVPEAFAAGAAIQIGTEPGDIRRGLQRMFSSTASELAEIGNHGLELVRTKFTWPRIATEMSAVYEWLLGRREKPSCVVL